MIHIYDSDAVETREQVFPTLFPDGTSQVWKLSQRVLDAEHVTVDWRFEAEAELMHLASLKRLLDRPKGPWPTVKLRMPFLPYARQDKHTSNESTFNLRVFGEMLNYLGFAAVHVLDPHNPTVSEAVIRRLRIDDVEVIHRQVLGDFLPDALVFPDKGASERYGQEATLDLVPSLIFEKTRDQSTGAITGHRLSTVTAPGVLDTAQKFLIIDDICDGGATFASVAANLRKRLPKKRDAKIGLFVTHGIFSKGLDPVVRDIDQVFTTDSLPRAKDAGKLFDPQLLKVYEV